jgi:integrase
MSSAPHVGASGRRGAIRIWTAEQVKRFETVIAEQSGELYALWLLVALTGLRRSEALGLRWMDVDLPRGRSRCGRSS